MKIFKERKKRRKTEIDEIQSFIEREHFDDRDGAACIFFLIPVLIGFLFLMGKAINIV